MRKRVANKIGVKHMWNVMLYRWPTLRRATKVLDRLWRRHGEPVQR